MPESQFISAARLKRLLAFVAVAFVALLALGPVMPDGTRTGFAMGWMLMFLVGCWLMLKGGDAKPGDGT